MRRKRMRKLQKQLAVELDMLLPRLGANNKSYKWAGRRSVGRTGRSLVEILVDAAKNVRSILEAKGMNGPVGDAAGRSAMGGGDVGGSKTLASVHTGFYKQGLLASQSLGLIEVSLPDLSLLECSAAFRTFARVAPAGSAYSQRLHELLPQCDLLAVHALISKVRPSAPAPVVACARCAVTIVAVCFSAPCVSVREQTRGKRELALERGKREQVRVCATRARVPGCIWWAVTSALASFD